MKKIVFIVYKYYCIGRYSEEAYGIALIVISGVLISNVMCLIVLLDVPLLIEWFGILERSKQCLYLSIFLLLAVLVLRRVFKKDNIVNAKLSKSDISKAKMYLYAYAIVSFSLFGFILLNKK